MEFVVFLTAVLLCLIFHLGKTAVEADVEIQSVEIPSRARLVSDVILNCTVINKGADNEVKWIHKDNNYETELSVDNRVVSVFNPTLLDGNSKYTVDMTSSNGQTTISLYIRLLGRKDSGTYICQVKVQAQYLQKAVSMLVVVPPSIVQSQSSIVGHVREGESISLECAAYGTPTPNITWTTAAQGVVYQGPIFNLTNVKKDAAGIYTCIADNDVTPQASHDVTVKVMYAPEISVGQVYLSLRSATGLCVAMQTRCVFKAEPAAEIQWYQVDSSRDMQLPSNKDGFLVRNSAVPAMYSTTTTSVLDISNHTLLSGWNSQTSSVTYKFRCKGYNSVGENYATASLTSTKDCVLPDCRIFNITESAFCKTFGICTTGGTPRYNAAILDLLYVILFSSWTAKFYMNYM